MSLRSSSNVKWPKSGASFQSQQLAHSERQQLAMKGGARSHSWWWDSHISPKNSKWLEDNLNEMDSKVKAMLRLIEEDADSFAKRAEMYYKKRPELTALVEEFYRAYRHLAERYDQLTGDIRQNVPNFQAQFGLSDDSSPASPVKSKVRQRAAGLNTFLSPATPTRSQETYGKDGKAGSTSSSSDSDSDSKFRKEGEEIQQLMLEIEQLKENLDKSLLDKDGLQTQLNELQEELNRLQQENGRIQEEKSSLQIEISSGIEHARKLQEEANHFQEAIAISKVETQKFIAHRSQLEINLEEFRMQLLALHDEKGKLSDEVVRGCEQVRNLEEQGTELNRIIDTMKSEQAAADANRRKLESDIDMLMKEKASLADERLLNFGQIKRLEEELQDMLSNSEERERHVLELEQELQRLEQDLVHSRQEHATQLEVSETGKVKVNELKLELSRLDENNSKLVTELSSKSGQIRLLETDLRKLQDAVVALQDEKAKFSLDLQIALTQSSTLEKKCWQQEAMLVQLQEERSKMNVDYTEISQHRSVLLVEKSELDVQIKTLDSRNSRLLEEIQEIRSSNEDLRGRVQQYVEEIQALQSNIQGLTDQLSSSKLIEEDKVNALTMEISELKIEISRLKLELARGSAELKSLQDQRDMWTLEKTKMVEEIEKFSEEKRGFLNSLNEWTDHRRNLELNHEALQKKTRDVEDNLIFHQTEHSRIQSELSVKTERITMLEGAVGKLQIEIESLHIEIKNLQDELQGLRKENQEMKMHSEISTTQQQNVELDIQKLVLALQNAHESDSFKIDDYKWHTGDLLPKHLSLRHVEEKVFHLLAQRETRKRDSASHAERLKGLEEELIRRTHLYEVLRADYDKLAAKLENGSNDFQVLQSQIPQLEEKINFLEEENKKLSEELLMKVKLFEETFSRLEREKAELGREKTEFYEKLLTEKDTLAAEVLGSQVLQKEIQELHKLLEDAEIKIKTLIENSSSLSLKHEVAINELQALQIKFAGLHDENVRLGSEVLSRSVSITELQELVSGFETRKIEMETEAKGREEHFIVLEKKIATLQDENDQLDQRLKSSTEELRIVKEEILRLHQLHIDFQSENESLKVYKQRSLDESSVLATKLESVQKHLFEQQTMNAGLEAELKKAEARIEELQGESLKLQNEKQALTVEIASCAVTMNSLRAERDSLEGEVKQLRNELRIGGEQFLLKTEEIKSVNYSLEGLREEILRLSEELRKKVEDYSRVESALNAVEEERLSLRNTNEKLSEAVSSGVSVIDRLKKEAEELLAEKYVLDQQVVERTDEIQVSQKQCLMLQQNEQQLREVVEVKEQEIRKLEEEVRNLRVTSFTVTQEKEKLSAELRLGIHRYVALENLFKSLQQDLIQRSEQGSKASAVSSFMEKLTREVVELKERLGHLHDGLASKQDEVDGFQRKNEELYDGVREREDEVMTLRDQLQVVREEHGAVQDELSTKVWFLQEIERTFRSLRETRVVFEGGKAVEIGEANLVQEEVTKLIQKVTKLSESLRMREEKADKLQTENVNLKEDLLRLREKERSYVVAVRFMRAEFACVVQRMRGLREENEAALNNLHREVDSLRLEVKRQSSVITERGEEKRQAINQLCLALDNSEEQRLLLVKKIRAVKFVAHDGGRSGGCCACLPV